MARIAISGVLVGVAAAWPGMVQDCKDGLLKLQGYSDFELAASCRSAFAPSTCRAVAASLGPQPWSNERMDASCSELATGFESMGLRGLEEAVEKKDTPEETAAKKQAKQQKYYDDIKKQEEEKKKREEAFRHIFEGGDDKKEKDEDGPLSKLFGKDKETEKQGPLAKLFEDDKKEEKKGPLAGILGPKDDEKEEKKGPLAGIFGPKDDEKEEKKGPLAGIFGPKDEKEPPKDEKKPGLPQTVGGEHEADQEKKGPLEHLLGAYQMTEETRSSVGLPAVVGVSLAAVTLVGAAVMLVVRRSRPVPPRFPDTVSLEEQTVE